MNGEAGGGDDSGQITGVGVGHQAVAGDQNQRSNLLEHRRLVRPPDASEQKRQDRRRRATDPGSDGPTERRWEGQVRGTESIYWRAVGGVDSLLDLTEQLGQKWLRGIRAVMALERPGLSKHPVT